jgi:photosystem II stability/assembly factor-like uncharacterized protein
MKSRITALLFLGFISLGVLLGFNVGGDNPYGSKSNSSSTGQPITISQQMNSTITFQDNFNSANDTVALKARGYKVWYRGSGPQGLTATWFQGNDVVFPAYEGPTTGYVAANFNAVTGTNNIDSWLVTPRMSVSAGDTISFWSRSPDASTFPDSITVSYSAAGDSVPEAATWVTVGRFKVSTAGWAISRYLAPSAGANARFAIRYKVINGGPNGANSDFIGVDYLTVATGGGGGSTSCAYNWTTQTSGTANQFLTVSTVSDQIGWAAGVGPTVVRTVNGGTTWTAATGTGITGDVYNIYAWSANEALCTTSPGATNIYKTTNGGTTWTQVFTQAGGFIDAIQMVSTTEGYAVGDPVGGKWTIVKTTDGGNTWARMATEPTQVGAEAGWNNSLQIIGNNMWFGTNATKVYRSTDLGLTWTSGATTGTVNTYAVHYNTASVGLAGGTAMVLSTNGGTSYSAVTNPGTAGNINGIEGAGSDWWAIRSGNTIYRSTNGAANWTNAYVSGTAVFQDLDFAVTGSNTCPSGWAVGNGGVIAKMTGSLVGVSSVSSEVPSSFLLKQNYPNPFNPTTNINFSLPKSGLVTLKVYDMTGKEVAVVLNEFKNAGTYIVGFSAANLPSGAYFYRLSSGNLVDTKKMILVK